jgi:Trypsin Inhibitor like cysteine rich domain
MKILIWFVSTITLVAGWSQGGPAGLPGPGSPCPTNTLLHKEITSYCGNRCETSCSNMGEDVDPNVVANTNQEGCIYGCYCIDGEIRNDDGKCVVQKSDTCGE